MQKPNLGVIKQERKTNIHTTYAKTTYCYNGVGQTILEIEFQILIHRWFHEIFLNYTSSPG